MPKRARKKTIDQVDVSGKRVLMRVDFNVPLDAGGQITDDRRIRLAVPSIRSVVDRGGRLILISHLGRPRGTGPEPALSLRPAAVRLGELLPGVNVRFAAGDCAGPEVAEEVRAFGDGGVLMLENLRFNPGEKSRDSEFARVLSSYGDVYCNEAFGSAHRRDASTLGLPQAMQGKPRVAGLLLDTELRYLSEALADPRRPFVAVLGGAKVSDKLGAIANLMNRVDTILIGGAMAYTFLEALGHGIGNSLSRPEMLETARGIIDQARAGGTDLILPSDHVCGRELTPDTAVEVFSDSIPDGWMGLDIGPETCRRYARVLEEAATVVWNGPVGAFETPPFDVGTRQVARAAAHATERGAITIVGGGDTAAAVEEFGLTGGFSHVSTGGGASLRMLEGAPLDRIAVLDEAALSFEPKVS